MIPIILHKIYLVFKNKITILTIIHMIQMIKINTSIKGISSLLATCNASSLSIEYEHLEDDNFDGR